MLGTIWKKIIGENNDDILERNNVHSHSNNTIDICNLILKTEEKNEESDIFQEQLLYAMQLGDISDENSLFRQQLDHSHTTIGRLTLWNWLHKPLENTSTIYARRAQYKTITSDEVHLRTLKQQMSIMEDAWQSLCWCWEESDTKKEVMQQVEFVGIAEPLNRIPFAQTTYHHLRITGMPLLHCASPLIPLIITYLILHFSGSGISFKQYWDISSGMFQDTFWWGGNAGRNFGGMVMQIIKWLWYILFFVNACVIIYHSYRHYKLLSLVYMHTRYAAYWIQTAVHYATNLIHKTNEEDISIKIQEICNWSKQIGHPNTCSLGMFTHAHEYLHIYHLILSSKEECQILLYSVGEMDAQISIHSLLNTKKDLFHIPEIIDSVSTPILECKEAIHPGLDKFQTPHTVSLDTNVVVTGANGSGKSTLIRTLLLNVLLAQSYGICTSKHMRWTPFKTFRGYMLTPDTCGEESLFQAQIRRIESYIASAKQNDKNGSFSLLIVDEIFNSTNPLEAMLLSYAYASRIGECTPNSRLILTTHYPLMTLLEKDKQSSYINWCMKKTEQQNQTVQYMLHKNQICNHSSGIEMVSTMTQLFTEQDILKLKEGYEQIHEHMQSMPLPDMCPKNEKPRKKKRKKNNHNSKIDVKKNE